VFSISFHPLFIMRPHWLLPQGGGEELRWNFFQYLVDNTYVLLGLAFLGYAGYHWFGSRRAGTRSTPAARTGHTIAEQQESVG
jgi:alpha-1,2-mannosyltransferase